MSQVPVASTYNLSYMGAEIRGIQVQSQPWANSSQDPISKIPKKELAEWLKQ
jgi:hypothetical protein